VYFAIDDLVSDRSSVQSFPLLLERLGTVWMAGAAAETLIYGKAEGGADDRAQLASALQRAGLSPLAQTQKTRWVALQAQQLIESHRPAYDALVEALRQRQPLEACYQAIQSSET
jgi:hypothetical protein